MGTLYITGDTQSDKLLNSNGTALLIGMLLDQQVPMEWAFSGPATLKKRLGHLDPKKISQMDVEEFVSVCAEKPAIHRFPASMGRRIHELCGIIAAQYKNKGENIWADLTDAKDLTARLRVLPGYGEEKTQIFIALLAKRMGVKLKNWKTEAGVFSDENPRTVADIVSPETLLLVRSWKKAEKAADLDKRGNPLKKTPAKKTPAKKTPTKKS
jgi:uncharacterized HhH-GPD family protein